MVKITAGDILANIVLLLSILGAMGAAYKLIRDSIINRTIRFKYEQDEITKREIEKAKETSVGHKALELLKDEISVLSESKNLDAKRLEKLEQIIHQLEFIKEIVEKRMLANIGKDMI